jgi:hypothetical protein
MTRAKTQSALNPPFIPLLSKGDERGILLCILGVPSTLLRTGLARENFLKWFCQVFQGEHLACSDRYGELFEP